MRKVLNLTPPDIAKRAQTFGRWWLARATAILASAVLPLAAGCSRAPTFNVLGSFFPSWILCALIGIVLAVIVRWFFVRIKLEPQLSPLIVVYPCLALFFTFTVWLLFFS